MLAKSLISILLLVIVASLSQTGVNGKRNFQVYFTNVSTKSFSDQLKLNSTVDRTVGSVTFYLNVLANIFRPYVRALAYTDSGNGLYDLELFNRTIDLCMLFKNQHYEPLLQVGFKILKQETGILLPTRCPVIKGLYSIKRYIINGGMLPPTMPEKKVFVKITFLSKDDAILRDLGMHSGYIRIERIRRTKM